MAEVTLSAKQQTVLALLAQGSTALAAAEAVGVHRNTISNWRRTDARFKSEFAHVLYEQNLHWRDGLQSLGDLSVGGLRFILTADNAPMPLVLKASLAVLDRLTKPAPAPPSFAPSDSLQPEPEIPAEVPSRETEPPLNENCATTSDPAQSCTTRPTQNAKEVVEMKCDALDLALSLKSLDLPAVDAFLSEFDFYTQNLKQPVSR